MTEAAFHRNRILGAAFLCAALVLFLQGAFFLVARAQTPSATKLEGRVLDGTASSSSRSVAGLPVTLFQMGSSGPVTRTVQTDTSGGFAFDDLAVTPSSPFFISTDYAGIHYFSDIFQSTTEITAPVTLTVYETTTIPAGFAIDRAHFILDASTAQVKGLEVLQLANPTDRAFLLPLPLPDNASSVQFNDPRDEFRAVRSSDGSIAFPVLPTTDTILMGVLLNAPSGDFTIQIGTPITIGQLNVLVSQQGGTQVSSSALRPGPIFAPPANPQTPSQPPQTYWQLTGTNITPDSPVQVKIARSTNLADSPALRYAVVLGGGGLAAILLLAYPLIRRRRARPALLEGEVVDERLERLQAIADLDDAFDAGQIDEEHYRTEREALKAELINDSDAEA